MCQYCECEFVGNKPVVALGNEEKGIDLIVESGFIYAYCKCGVHSVAEINFCPMCGKKID